MKIFKICSSEFLPAPQDRDIDHIYFLYDTLDIYFGRTQYSGLYCIVAEIPDSSTPDDLPVKNMLYIKMNGDVWMVKDNIPEMIAQIEDPSETEYLVKAGTTFLLRSGYRYIDKQTKSINLPFQNGIFQFSSIVDKPVMINNNTILIYNEETGHFEIEGDRYYDEYGRNPEILNYTAQNTNSVNTYIQNDHIHADVRISPKAGNIIQTRPDGLYANTKDFVSVDEFNDLVTRTNAELDALRNYLEQIRQTLASIDITLNDETLREKIHTELEEYAPMLDEAIENYEEIIEQFHVFEGELYGYIITNMTDLRTETVERIEDVHTSWGYFVDSFVTTVEEVAPGQYKLTVPFDVEPGYQLCYTIGSEKVYLEYDQDVTGYTEFDSGDVVAASSGDVITIAYCVIDNGLLVRSCSYCDIE